MSDRDRLLATGRTEVGRVRSTEIKVENFGEKVTVRDEMHAKANHYIKQSRPYFPNKKLPTYIDCPYLLRIARVLCVASLLGALVEAGVSKFIAVFFFIACVLFFYLYIQHEWVNQESLRVVYRQPVLAHQRSENDFYRVTITELNGVALQNYQAGIGFIQLSQGKIEFQAFNKTAMKYMSDARCHSRLMLVLFTMASAYNFYFMLAGLVIENRDWES